MVRAEGPGQPPFQEHIELIQSFLSHREAVVERIQEGLNAQRKPVQYLQDARLLSRQFEDCFFTLAAVTSNQSQLRGQLQAAHWARGFRPSDMPGVHNDLIDPAQMIVRAFHLWRQTRWPGRNGRIRYAQTLFNLYLLRCLELLSMRLWDAESNGAGARLAQIQGLLDELWRSSPADQPVFVRDARWLFPLAQSPTTDDLAPYFEVTKHIAESLSEADRIEIQKASVQMAGGHLRSQLRHYCIKNGVSLEENSLILNARNSNALDFAITIQGLVPLLGAYERAIDGGERRARLELADAICQGISPDPDLFVNRVDLLGPYSMIEHLFITADRAGHAAYTPMGRRHIQLLQEYAARIGRLSRALHEDIGHFKPLVGTYSPYGVIYGFSSNLTEHMALKALQPDAAIHLSVEDVFTDRQASTDKLAWVSGWRKLPHITEEVQKLFDYPQQFAEDIYSRIERALQEHLANGDTGAVGNTGRLFIPVADDAQSDPEAAQIPDLSLQYIASSDAQIVAALKAHPYDESRLLHDRREGMFLVSYQTAAGWVAITKDVLTEVLGTGRDAQLAGLPEVAAAVLRLMCPDLVHSQRRA